MRKLLTISLVLVALVAFLAVALAAEEAKKEVKHEYVGAAKCKMCHKDQHTSWLETGHAKAFDKLSAEEQKKEECVGCHSTGKMPDGTLITSVECEACHGPGADYKSAKIMSKSKWAADPETHKKMAIDAGLIYPTVENCKNCHKKEGNANFKEFDIAKARGTVHTMSAK